MFFISPGGMFPCSRKTGAWRNRGCNYCYYGSNGFGIPAYFIYVWTSWYILQTVFDHHGQFHCDFSIDRVDADTGIVCNAVEK